MKLYFAFGSLASQYSLTDACVHTNTIEGEIPQERQELEPERGKEGSTEGRAFNSRMFAPRKQLYWRMPVLKTATGIERQKGTDRGQHTAEEERTDEIDENGRQRAREEVVALKNITGDEVEEFLG